jgi:hypothetical protein
MWSCIKLGLLFVISFVVTIAVIISAMVLLGSMVPRVD